MSYSHIVRKWKLNVDTYSLVMRCGEEDGVEEDGGEEDGGEEDGEEEDGELTN